MAWLWVGLGLRVEWSLEGCVCVCDGRLSFVDNVLTVTWRSVSDGHGSEKVDRLRIPGLCLRCSISHCRTFSSLLHLPLILLP